jgi:hypothetical protein
MQFGIREHFECIVLPAIEAYRASEVDLSAAAQGEDYALVVSARYTALREGAAAASFLHHFADIVAARPEADLPNFKSNPRVAEDWLLNKYNATDVKLLKDVAEAIKHAILTRGGPRDVQEAGQVLVASRPFGEGRYGEGKFGGIDEVWVLAKSGRRSLSAIIKNVSDAWLQALDDHNL